MKRVATLFATIWFAVAVTPTNAQVLPPSIDPNDPGTFPPGFTSTFVSDNFFGSPVTLENTAVSGPFSLNPFEIVEFAATPELPDPAGTAPPIDRLFRHDISFTVNDTVFGNAILRDLPNLFMSALREDILQPTFGLFEDSVDLGNIVAGLVTQDPPPALPAEITFSDLVPGTQYIIRVAGVLNGFASIPQGEGAGDFGWHGQYQGNLFVAPLPAAAVFMLTAFAGLFGLAGWRRLRPS